MRALFIAPIAALLLTSALHAQTGTATPGLTWAPAPPIFPSGAEMAVVSGDPSQPGPFTVEISFPKGYRLAPHYHTTDEHVEIKRGALLVGMGDVFDLRRTQLLSLGDTSTIPAFDHHYAATRIPTIISISAEGPFSMTYVHPTDDPTQAKSSSY
jgi:hypothetical protein